MKKNVKLLLFVTLAFCFNTLIINASDDDSSPDSDAAIARQKENIEKYCDSGEQLSGCLYDNKNSLYTKTKEKKYYYYYTLGASAEITATYEIPGNIELTRGYQTFDGKGNAVFAGCYRYNMEYYNEVSTYFIFQIIYGNNSNNCGVTKSFIVPAQGTPKLSRFGTFSGQEFIYDGSLMIGTPDVATLNDWVAKKDGDCPKVFGYTANVNFLTSSKNKYIFSNNTSDFNIKTFSFLTGEQYKGRPGCTVEDVDGKEKAQELLNKVLDDINNKACPSKIEDMNSFSDEFESWYKDLRENNEYRVLWSSGLIDEVTHKSVEVQINEAIHKKTNDCQYKICNISSSKRSIIESNLGDECKNGCTLSNIKQPVEGTNSKCYCCGEKLRCTFQWFDGNGESCYIEDNIPKDQCIGTKTDLKCRKCLINAYDKAKLTDEEKSCMAGSEIAKLLTERNLEESNNEAASADKEREIEENRTIREEIYERLGFGKIPFSYDFNISNENLTCKEILGDNLVKIVKTSILIVQIVAAIIAIVKAMIVLIPPIIAKDADALKKSQSTLITMAIILVIIFTFRPIVKLIGSMLNFDISCIL